MNGPYDLVDDMPDEARRDFAGDLLLLIGEREPTRDEVIALRIAGDPEIFNAEIPLSVAFVVVLQLVDRGHLDEDNIERYCRESS